MRPITGIAMTSGAALDARPRQRSGSAARAIWLRKRWITYSPVKTTSDASQRHLVAIGFDEIGDYGVEFDLDEKISWAVEEPSAGSRRRSMT